MRAEPRQGGIDVIHLLTGWQFRAVDHDHGQAKAARCGDLCNRTAAAGILGNDKVDPVVLHQRRIALCSERSPIDGHSAGGEGQRRVRRIDQSQNIVMLRVRRELGQMHPANSQKNAGRGSLQRGNRPCDVRCMGPEIAVLRLPRGAGQGNKRHTRLGTGGNRIAAHLCGKGMGGVDHMGDRFGFQIADQPGLPAKSADAQWQRLAFGSRYAPREGQGRGQTQIDQPGAQCGGLGRAAKDQKVGRHG